MNAGKRFESNFQKSIPDYILLHRLADAAQSFSNSSDLRFSNKNPFDFLLWDSKGRTLYALELKTVKGKSIDFERTEDESKAIHLHQIEGLTQWQKYDGVVSGFVIEFRQIETTIFLKIDDFNRLIKLIKKKSFTIQDLENNDIPYFKIPQEKLRVNYRYDIDHLISEIRNENKGECS